MLAGYCSNDSLATKRTFHINVPVQRIQTVLRALLLALLVAVAVAVMIVATVTRCH
jgi:hypothetical protein